MEHLSKLCRDLGGKTLIYGGGRKRGNLTLAEAFTEAEFFFQDLLPRIDDHGTVFCFEPLGKKDTDFINSVYDSIRLVQSIDHPSLKVQLDAKALFLNDELNLSVIQDASPYLVHVHANEPDLGILGTSGKHHHKFFGSVLHKINYQGFVSIEQKMVYKKDPIASLAKSVKILTECYK